MHIMLYNNVGLISARSEAIAFTSLLFDFPLYQSTGAERMSGEE